MESKCALKNKDELINDYLLGNLSPKEEEGFEEHYFACQECSSDLSKKILIIETIKNNVYSLFPDNILEFCLKQMRKGNYEKAKEILEKFTDNSRAHDLLNECESKLSEIISTYKLIRNFFSKFYPDEIRTFEIYWKELSKQEGFNKGKISYSFVNGWAFSDYERDFSLQIIEIILILRKKGIFNKIYWDKNKLEKWLKKELKKQTSDKLFQNNLIEYFLNISP